MKSVYNPVLKDIVGMISNDYFKIQRLKFWDFYSKLMGIDKINPEWFEKDGYTYPYMQDMDLETGEQKLSPVEGSLHAQLRNDIHSRFSRFYSLYEKQLMEFDREFKKDNFQSLIISSLKKIQKELQVIDAEENYLATIKTCYEQEFRRFFPERLVNESNLRKDGFIKYLKSESENGRISLKMLFDDLKDHNLIATYTDYNQFKILLGGKIPSKKIRWVGSKAQLVTFIKQLVSRPSIIQSENHWVVVENSFEVFKNGLKEFKLKKLHTATELTNEKKIRELENLIKDL